MRSNGRTLSVVAAIAVGAALWAAWPAREGTSKGDADLSAAARATPESGLRDVGSSRPEAGPGAASRVAREEWAPSADPTAFVVRFVDRQGAPLAGRRLELGEESGPWRVAATPAITALFLTTNADGECRLTLQPGDVRRFVVRFGAALAGRADGETLCASRVDGGELLDPATVRAPGPGAVRIVLAPVPAWTARLVDAAGNAVSNGRATFTVEGVASERASIEVWKTANRSGVVRYEPAPRLDHPEIETWRTVRFVATVNGSTRTYEARKALEPDGSVDFGDVVVDAPRFVRFRVEDESGAPVRGASLTEALPDGWPVGGHNFGDLAGEPGFVRWIVEPQAKSALAGAPGFVDERVSLLGAEDVPGREPPVVRLSRPVRVVVRWPVSKDVDFAALSIAATISADSPVTPHFFGERYERARPEKVADPAAPITKEDAWRARASHASTLDGVRTTVFDNVRPGVAFRIERRSPTGLVDVRHVDALLPTGEAVVELPPPSLRRVALRLSGPDGTAASASVTAAYPATGERVPVGWTDQDGYWRGIVTASAFALSAVRPGESRALELAVAAGTVDLELAQAFSTSAPALPTIDGGR